MLGKKTSAIDAINYIKENYYILTKEQIIEQLVKHTRLTIKSAESIFETAEAEIYIEERDKAREEVKYKGKERDFFKFDTSRLWREV